MPTTRGRGARVFTLQRLARSLAWLRNPLLTSVNRFRQKLAHAAACRNVHAAINVNLRFRLLRMCVCVSLSLSLSVSLWLWLSVSVSV